jgi:hypothetical protein
VDGVAGREPRRHQPRLHVAQLLRDRRELGERLAVQLALAAEGVLEEYATWMPAPSSPMRFSAGTRQSSKISSPSLKPCRPAGRARIAEPQAGPVALDHERRQPARAGACAHHDAVDRAIAPIAPLTRDHDRLGHVAERHAAVAARDRHANQPCAAISRARPCSTVRRSSSSGTRGLSSRSANARTSSRSA